MGSADVVDVGRRTIMATEGMELGRVVVLRAAVCGRWAV